jgi:hypothetical protein
MLMSRSGVVVAACVAASFCGSAHAQRDVELSRFQPALDADSFIGVQGTRTPGAGNVAIGLFTDYGGGLLRVDRANGDDAELIAHRMSGTLSIEGGLGGRTALALSLPMVLYQQGDKLTPSDSKLPAFAVADPEMHLRYRFLGDPTKDDVQRRDGPGIALQGGVALPAGDQDAFTGEGAVRTHLQLLADMHIFSAGIGATVGWSHRFEGQNLYGAKLHDALTFGAGLEVPIPPLFPLSGLLELRGATDFRSSAATAIEAELGARLRFASGVVLTLAGGLAVTDGVGEPGGRVIAGLWYTPVTSDTDHDGIPDKRDQCPPLPEDFDGFQDTDGCPDPDNDNDLVPDADDLCPNQEALEDHDDNEDGCTDK